MNKHSNVSKIIDQNVEDNHNSIDQELSSPQQIKEHILFLIQRNDLNSKEIITRLKKIDVLIETLNVQLKAFIAMDPSKENIDIQTLISNCWETIKIHEDTKNSILQEYTKIKQDNEALKQRVEMLEEEIENLKAKNKRDALTGLYNKKTFNKAINIITRDKIKWVTIAFIDIDNFKSINTNFGHRVWDIALQHFAHFLFKNVDDSKTGLFRYGWEEFSIITRHSHEKIVQQLQEAMNDLKTNYIPENLTKWDSLKLTFSAGVTTYDPEIHSDYTLLIDDVDQKCKKSKNNGKDQITV